MDGAFSGDQFATALQSCGLARKKEFFEQTQLEERANRLYFLEEVLYALVGVDFLWEWSGPPSPLRQEAAFEQYSPRYPAWPFVLTFLKEDRSTPLSQKCQSDIKAEVLLNSFNLSGSAQAPES